MLLRTTKKTADLVYDPAQGSSNWINDNINITDIQKHLPSKQEGMTREMSKTLRTYDEDGIYIAKPVWNCFRDNTPHEILTRQYKLGEFSITPDWSPATHLEFNFPAALFAVDTVFLYLKPFKWLNAGIEISIQINATVFHQGMMSSSFLHDTTTDVAQLNNAELSAMRAVYYNYSTSDSAVLRYSWVAPSFGANIANPLEGASIGKLILSPLVQLQNANGGEEVITVSVYARFIDPVATGYRTVTTAGRVAKQSANQEEVAKTTNHSLFGPVGDGIKGIMHVADGVIGDIEDLGDLFTGGLLDKPTALDYPTKVYDDIGSEFVTGKGTSLATKLQMYPEFKLGEQQGWEQNWFTTKQTFRQLAGRPMLHSVLDASASAFTYKLGCTPGFLGTENVYQEAGDTIVQPDYLMQVSSLHAYWRGSIKYHIKFVTSAMTQARIRIAYMIEDTPDDFGGDNPSIIVDIKGTTEVNLTVPYLWDQIMREGESTVFDIPALWFKYVTPPVSSGVAAPDITMVVFRSGGPDLIVAQPITRIGTPQALGVVEKQSMLSHVFKHDKFPSFSKNDKIMKMKGVTVTEQAGFIGDMFKRYYAWERDVPDENQAITDQFLMGTAPSFNVPGTFHPFPYYMSLFKYVRGGARYGFQAASADVSVNYITPSQTPLNYNAGAGFYLQDTAKNRFAFVELPYMSTMPYLCRTQNTSFKSVYAPKYTTIAGPSDAEGRFLAFSDDRYMFYLLPPPRVIIPPAKKVIPPKPKGKN